MNRSTIKAIFSCMMIAVFVCTAYGARQPKTNIFCVGDSIVLGNKGTYVYSDILQALLDRQYGADKTVVFNYSFFDMNTAQCYKLVSDLLEKQNSNTEFVVVMAGEANFYNINGFANYLFSVGRYQPQEAFVHEYDIDAVEKLNTGVASMYNSPLVNSEKASLKYIVSAAYRSLAGTTPKKIDGYTAKVIPSFHILSDETEAVVAPLSFATRYKFAWDNINAGNYSQAEDILQDMLKDSPLNSSIYYTLGSLYLMGEGKRINQALKMFEEGILVNPFDPSNQCYKGLSVMYMSYDGRITSEILYFARVMKSYLGERIPEINSITAMNTTDHNTKISNINDWIVSDIKRLNELCKSKGVRLIVVDYPLDAKVNNLLRNSFGLSNIIFVDNSGVSAADGNSPSARLYVDTAKNIMEAINKNKIIKK